MLDKNSSVFIFGDSEFTQKLKQKLNQNGFKNIHNQILNTFNYKEYLDKLKPNIILLDVEKYIDVELQKSILEYSVNIGIKNIYMFNNFRYDFKYKDYITNLKYDIYYTIGGEYKEDDKNTIHNLIRRMHDVKYHGGYSVRVFGNDRKMNVLFIDDLVNGVFFILTYKNLRYKNLFINNCSELNMRRIAHHIKESINYEGELFFDIKEVEQKPDTFYSINNLGWKSEFELEKTVRKIYNYNLLNKHKYFTIF